MNEATPIHVTGRIHDETAPQEESLAVPLAFSGSLTFADGNHATFAYTVNAVSQVKQITRQIFSAPGTVCA